MPIYSSNLGSSLPKNFKNKTLPSSLSLSTSKRLASMMRLSPEIEQRSTNSKKKNFRIINSRKLSSTIRILTMN